MVPCWWPAALDVIWHIYSHLHCSKGDGGRESPSSVEAAPTMGQVPCEFWADQPIFIFQPAAPDVIWHIYLHLYCSSRDGGRDLLSLGEAFPYHGGGPLWVLGRLALVQFFRGRVETRVLPALPCPGWCIIHGWQLQTGFGTFTHTCTTPQGMVVGTCHLQWKQPLPWGRSPVSFGQISQPSFFNRQLQTWFGTFTHTCTAPQGMMVGTCSLQWKQPLRWGRSPVSFGQIGLGSVFQEKSWDKGSFQPCPAQDGASSMASGSAHDLAHLLAPVLLLKGWW